MVFPFPFPTPELDVLQLSVPPIADDWPLVLCFPPLSHQTPSSIALQYPFLPPPDGYCPLFPGNLVTTLSSFLNIWVPPGHILAIPSNHSGYDIFSAWPLLSLLSLSLCAHGPCDWLPPLTKTTGLCFCCLHCSNANMILTFLVDAKTTSIGNARHQLENFGNGFVLKTWSSWLLGTISMIALVTTKLENTFLHGHGEITTAITETGTNPSGLGCWAWFKLSSNSGSTAKIVSAYWPSEAQVLCWFCNTLTYAAKEILATPVKPISTTFPLPSRPGTALVKELPSWLTGMEISRKLS